MPAPGSWPAPPPARAARAAILQLLTTGGGSGCHCCYASPPLRIAAAGAARPPSMPAARRGAARPGRRSAFEREGPLAAGGWAGCGAARLLADEGQHSAPLALLLVLDLPRRRDSPPAAHNHRMRSRRPLWRMPNTRPSSRQSPQAEASRLEPSRVAALRGS